MSDNTLLKSINDIDDDLIIEAENFKPSKAKKPLKLRGALIAAAAVFVVGIGGVAAASISKANVANAGRPDFEEVTVKSGNYYLNGDVDSGLWIEITPETISLKGDDIEKSLREAITAMYREDQPDLVELNEAAMQTNLDKSKLLYCEEKPYLASVWYGSEKYRCLIHVSRFNTPVENREDLLNSGASFLYDDITNKIHLGLFKGFGDFILVE